MSHCRTRIHRRSAPPTIRSVCGGHWLHIIPTPRSPASSIAKAVQRPQDCRLRQIVCRACGRTGRSPCFEPKQQVQDGECMTIEKAARALGIAPSTLHRCLNDGFIAGEQITPGAPWRIRINDELRSRFVESAPEGYVKMFKAMNLLGVSRQTILQRVKRGELKAVHVYRGRAKGIRIQVPAVAPDLFDPLKKTEGVV